MQYIHVKPETEAWGYLDLFWHQDEQWRAHENRIEALIGCSTHQNLIMETKDLGLKQVPDHLNPYFRVADRSGVRWAKQNSKIHKEWLALAKELKLRSISKGFIAMCLQINARNLGYPVVKSFLPPMFGEYYMIAEKSEEWNNREWAELMAEEDFLPIRMKWLQENPKEDNDDQKNRNMDSSNVSQEGAAEGV